MNWKNILGWAMMLGPLALLLGGVAFLTNGLMGMLTLLLFVLGAFVSAWGFVIIMETMGID